MDAASAACFLASSSSPGRPRRLRPMAGSRAAFLQVAEGGREHAGLQAPGGAAPRPVGPQGHRSRRDDPGHVTIELNRRGRRGGIAEVRDDGGLPRRVDKQRVAADSAVRDARRPQRQQLPVDVIDGGVGDVGGARFREPPSGGQPGHHQRVLRRSGRGAGAGEFRHGRADLRGPQGDESLRSTCCSRVMVRLGPESRYSRNRPALVNSPASAASFPSTDTSRRRPGEVPGVFPSPRTSPPPRPAGPTAAPGSPGRRVPRAAAARPRPRASRAASRRPGGRPRRRPADGQFPSTLSGNPWPRPLRPGPRGQ